MSNDPTPAHMLGPHVVGHRVVVRRLVRGESGPSGGPAMTDVLGTCTAWADGVCVIEPDAGAAGEPVRIPIGDIVSGKPVPPRPSTRHRVSEHEAQVRALALWPDLETRPLGDWVLRRSGTSRARRANSALAMGPSGATGEYDDVVGFYREFGQRPIAAVLPGSPEEAIFLEREWVPESNDGWTVFELAGVALARRSLAGVALPGGDVRLTGNDSVVTASVLVDGREVATGTAAYDDDWVGFRGIEVDPGERGRGFGLLVMARLLDWGAELGATTAYLQVLDDNVRAFALYDGLGFTVHHEYRYLAEPLPD